MKIQLSGQPIEFKVDTDGTSITGSVTDLTNKMVIQFALSSIDCEVLAAAFRTLASEVKRNT